MFKHLEDRLRRKRHAVIVVAEGAGQDLLAHEAREKDASGNVKHADIGVYLRQRLIDHFAGHDGAQISAGTDTALDQALGTILAGAGADGLYVAMGDGFEMAAMVAAVEAQSAAA